MTTYTFANLTSPETVDTIRARILAALTSDGLPTASWAPSALGGTENLRLDAVAAVLAKYSAARIAEAVNGRMLPLSSGDFLHYLAKHFYKLTWREASSTIQNVALYATSANVPSYSFQPGDVRVASPLTGNRYVNIDAGKFSKESTLAAPLMLRFQAENPGAQYADSDGTVTTMVTAQAGVRCVNVRPSQFLPQRLNGTSTGILVGSFQDPSVAPTYGSIRIRIETSGDVGAAGYSISFDGGGTWAFAGVLRPVNNVDAVSTVTATNGTTPSFIAGDVFTLLVGQAIEQQGHDDESDDALQRRCGLRWLSLSKVPTEDKVSLWVFEASDEVVKVSADADPSRSGGTVVTVASATGPVSPAAIVDVEDYVSVRLTGYKGVPASGAPSPEETVRVVSVRALPIQPAGTVVVPRDQLASAQAAWLAAWQEYLISVPIGGQVGARVLLSKLEQTLADAGAYDAHNLSLTPGTITTEIDVPVGYAATVGTNSIVWQVS